MDKVEPLLKDIGMKEYEAKAFTAVLRCGICSAEQISEASQIPLTRVYETMAALQKLGLVTVLNTRPKKYRLISVDALSNLIEEMKRNTQQEIERATEILKQIKEIIPKAAPKDTEEVRDGFWIFRGRDTVIRKIMDEQKKSEKEILVFSDDFSWFPRFRKALESMIEDGVSVKAIINLNEKTINIVSELLKIGADVRGWDVKGLLGVIVDGKNAHLVSKIPRAGVKMEDYYGEQGSDDLFMYDCVYTENPVIVNMVKTYFDVFWWRGKRPQGLIAARQGKRFK